MFTFNVRQLRFVFLLTCACFSANATVIYKWVDKKGVTHFSQVRPVNQKFEEINSHSLEPAKVGSVAPTKQNTEVGQPHSQAASTESKLQASEICDRAKHSLNLLTTHTNLIKQADDGSKATTLTEAQRQEEIIQQRKRVKLFCPETKKH
ncbi:DUF4124 domain-containing protein [Parashewanella spongiae]|uniref:DUF4124 domain-containing protein n=1 Tax=Parashewanella spongiae TaxID=342950 RepID=A0A3A6TPR6_9GAMM|nr:DUF4124 domain-containing protein [Parashewanella spongiae]MCL1079585.1 DUF4124 domain-containing protein [Parashewanella spongiae]RJY07276.1 DUF4124 domain-containing protein [Parashewanella spongiae]